MYPGSVRESEVIKPFSRGLVNIGRCYRRGCGPAGVFPAMAVIVLTFSIYGRGADAIVSVRAIPPSGALEAGKISVLTVELDIQAPYHINGARPLEDYLIPTSLQFKPQEGVRFGRVIFPPAAIKKLEFSDKPMAVYQGVVKIPSEVLAGRELRGKDIALEGLVRYQACDDRSCLPPVSQPFSIRLQVEDSPSFQASNVSEPRSTAAVVSPDNTEAAIESASVDFEGKGIFLTFSLVFLGGLALNLTPCVYPMIPITISYFGGQSRGKRGSMLLHAFLYITGMSVTYSTLGVIAALTGSLFGSVFQYPAVLVGIALLMVLLALSMFDVYELEIPEFLNRLAGSSKGGFLGTLFMGLTVGIVAAPCIGPFVLGLLTYVGNEGNAVLGFLLFFALAFGMGTPFLVLGFCSGSISRLPRSGAWMIWVRRIFGFVLLAMAVYFLKPLFPTNLLYQLTLGLLMLLAGIYLAWIDPTVADGRTFPYVRNLLGVIFFGAAVYSMAIGVEAYINETVGSRTQVVVADQGIPAADTVEWLPYSPEMLARASRESRPLVIDFYADWCAPCKELDELTFAAPEVVAASREFVMLKVDLTLTGNPEAENLRQKYRARGVPTVVFLKPDGVEIGELRTIGFEPKHVFLSKMKRALELSSGT